MRAHIDLNICLLWLCLTLSNSQLIGKMSCEKKRWWVKIAVNDLSYNYSRMPKMWELSSSPMSKSCRVKKFWYENTMNQEQNWSSFICHHWDQYTGRLSADQNVNASIKACLRTHAGLSERSIVDTTTRLKTKKSVNK